MKSLRVLFLFFASALAPSAFLLAQDTASITGTVTDPSGAAVPGAQVTVTSVEQGTTRTATANSSGDYLFAALPVGHYDMSVTAPGFKKYEARAVKLDVGQRARNDIQMQVGAAQETVNVEGTNVAQVETQSSDLTGVVTGKQISQLELNGRDFKQLVTLVPGVSNQTGADEGGVGVTANNSFSINGGRVEYNNWEIDGGDNMDNGSNNTLNVTPSIDAIAEFKVLTSNFGAQYGRSGSGTVEVETKSGTNRFHGDAYEFVRNDIFNSKNYFDTSVQPYKKNDFGYTVGGPIWKDHTFFFWSEEWRKDRVPFNYNVPVPSVDERSGDFTDLCPNLTVTDPTQANADCPSGGPILSGFNPSDPNVQALLGMIPLPNSGVPGAAFYNATASLPTNWREELLRIDHNLTSKHRLTFRFIHDSWDTVTDSPLWTNAGSFPTVQTAFKGPGVGLVARLTSTLNPTLLNEFVFSYTTDHIILNNIGAWQRGPNVTIGGIFQNGFNGSLPGINLVGGDAYGGGFGEDPGYIPNGIYNSNPTYTYRDNMTKIMGKHNLQFGAYAVFGQKNEFGGELGPGSVPGYLTFDNSNRPGVFSTGNAFADLLLGKISSFGQQDQFVKYYNRYKILEPYFQDDWHATSRLTLNLGLRLSLFGTYREKQKQAFNFDPAHYVAGQTIVNPDGTVSNLTVDGLPPSVSDLPNGIVQCGVTPGVAVSCMQGHLFNPAPRIGFAYDPKGDGKTAIRGGYGIFFEHANGNEGNTESLENSPPLANAVTQNDIVGYTNIGAGFSTPPQFPLTVNAIPTKATWPYVQQWHLDIQHELPSHAVVTASYVGSKGTKLGRQTDLNQLAPLPLSLNPYAPGEFIDSNPTSPTFNTDCNALTVNGAPVTGQAATNLSVACGVSPDLFRKYQGYSDINHLEFKSSSIYHAFQLAARRSVGALQLSLAYTLSHSIDDSSDRFDGTFVNSFDPSSNRASSNFDQRHILNFSYVWDLPFFRSSSSGLTNKILGGWQYSGITSFSTGSPFSVSYGDVSDNAGVGNGVGTTSRPDLVGDPNSGFTQVPQSGLGPQFYNPAAFARPRGLTFGTAGRNTLRNPRRLNFDMALFKRFVITENMGFEFRAEAFNVFNHTQWGNIGGDAGSAGGSGTTSFPAGDFLYINSAHSPRIFQFGAKFIF